MNEVYHKLCQYAVVYKISIGSVGDHCTKVWIWVIDAVLAQSSTPAGIHFKWDIIVIICNIKPNKLMSHIWKELKRSTYNCTIYVILFSHNVSF